MNEFSLKHYDEFKQVLKNYQVSQRAMTALADLRFVAMVAPTSTGRNTVINKLMESGDYYFIVSDTTRPPQLRDGVMEQNGGTYFFRSEEDILADLQRGEFLEAAIIHEQQVSGISIRELEKAKSMNKIAITDMEVVGADTVDRVKPDATIIFLVPPSFEEWQRRIVSRGGMSEREIENRLRSADKEIKAALSHSYYNFVIAEDVERTTSLIDTIAKGGKNPEQDKAQTLAKQIHEQLQQKLITPNL
jgi:guanylate kinase